MTVVTAGQAERTERRFGNSECVVITYNTVTQNCRYQTRSEV